MVKLGPGFAPGGKTKTPSKVKAPTKAKAPAAKAPAAKAKAPTKAKAKAPTKAPTKAKPKAPVTEGHSRLSPSKAYRWMECPASAAESAKYEELEAPSPYAMYGTVAHELAAIELHASHRPRHKGNYGFDKMLNKLHKNTGVKIDAPMLAMVREYVDFVREVPGELHIETRVDPVVVPEASGTADAVIIEGGDCWVIDFKTGKVPVAAKDNPQLMLYALGVLKTLDPEGVIEKMHLVIHQRDANTHTVTRKAVLEFGEMARVRALWALSTKAPFNPGEIQCSYCPAKIGCEAFMNWAKTDSRPDHLKNRIRPITPAQASQMMTTLPLLRQYIASVEQMARNMILSGLKVPGYRVVKSVGHRKWVDVESVETELRETLGNIEGFAYTERTLLSPAQMEVKLKEMFDFPPDLSAFYVREPTRPVVVKDGDRREDYTPNMSAIEEFK